jgi:D-alanyl-D-alanine carboxypeptidase
MTAVVAALALSAAGTVVPAVGVTPASAHDRCHAEQCRLEEAADVLVRSPGGPPGVIVVVQRGAAVTSVTAGVADRSTHRAITPDDEMRLASVSKAFNGAAALALVSSGQLSLHDSVGRWLPSLPRRWWGITLGELLDHTSGIPDFSQQPSFLDDLLASLLKPPPPVALLASVECLPLLFRPGTNFAYSNSDNIIVGLMVEAATGESYEAVLRSTVLAPMGLAHTSLPGNEIIPAPFVHGYQIEPPNPPEDVSNLFAAGWTWAAGGIVSTPADTTRFIRAYVSGPTIDPATRRAQFHFVPGSSEPPGPGTNAAGLAIFRYTTRCGVVYGHTGNTAGYTQFAASNLAGTRSVTVSVNSQLSPTTNGRLFNQLRALDELGVCAALS